VKCTPKVVDVGEDGTATSQKRWDDWLANAADQTSAPTTPRFLDLDHPGIHSPRSSTGSNNAPSSSSLSTGPHPRYNGDSSSPSSGSPNYSPIPWVPDQPITSSPDYSHPSWFSADYSPSSLVDNPHQLPPAQNSLPPSPDYSPPSSNPPRPTEPETKDFLNQLGPSRDPTLPPSPAVPETKDFLSQLGPSRDPPLPPSPAVPETKDFLSQLGPGPSHPAEPETMDFLDLLLKGRIRRRTPSLMAPVP
jgi:hypothetical protein